MTIPVKWIIGLFVLMFLGALIASFMGGGDVAVTELSEAAADFGHSFETFSIKSIGDVFVTGGSFLFELGQFVGGCIYWNFAFFDGFEWIQTILILINIAVLMVILFDLWRAIKPFGS
jgi:hypothetical protein